MAELTFPFLSLGVAAPLATAVWARTRPDGATVRSAALASTGVSLLCALEALREVVAAGFAALGEPWTPASWLVVDGLSAAPLALFAAVAFGVLLILPKRDLRPGLIAGLLLVLGAIFLGYTAGNTVLLAAAWCASSAPLFLGGPDRHADASSHRWPLLPAVMLTASSISLFVGLGLMAQGRPAGADAFALGGGAASPGGAWAFAFLMLAVFLRKGIFPFHSWVLTAFKRGPLLSTALVLNGHLAAYLVARVAIPAFPDIAGSALSVVGDLALFTGIYAAVVALAERDPRRLIGLLVVSQASFILAGLETATAEGVTGGLVYWMVVTVATTSLVAVLRLLETRVSRPLAGAAYLGLARPFPRMAVFFLVSGLALVGLPGTLGFCADELLLHGAMESHPQLGLALPLATALNAFHIFRLFARLFLGSRGPALPGVPDARPAERWALTFGLLFLIGGGLFPAAAVGLRAPAAETILAAARQAGGALAGLLP